ncbi:MAG: EamA family transporter [Lachnospiraceae bacterium]
MVSYIWPIVLVIISNILYQICAKSVPHAMHPMASLTITYAVGAVISFIMYFALNKNGNLLREYSKLNWAPFVLGLVIVGLEVGFIYAYKAGWQVSMASIIQSAFVSVALIFVGLMLYHEQITRNKILGVGICLIGLYFINK